MSLLVPLAFHRVHRRECETRVRGMTLVELLVGLAITTLMTIAGWRAIETLQTARDVTQRDVALWQSLDSLFESIEADLRRADLSRFNGNAAGFDFRLNALVATEPSANARYRLAGAGERANVVRDTSDGSLTFGGLSSLRFAYHLRDQRTGAPITSDVTDRYPRAIEIVVAIVGNEGAAAREVRRVLVLQ
jgi:type II secretory pathway pseudopilin PulG